MLLSHKIIESVNSPTSCNRYLFTHAKNKIQMRAGIKPSKMLAIIGFAFFASLISGYSLVSSSSETEFWTALDQEIGC